MQTMTMKQKKSWYQFPLVWMIILIPFSAVITGVILAWLAIDTNDGLVADDYYRAGLAINQVLRRDDEATRLHLSGDLSYDAATRTINLYLNQGRLNKLPDSVLLNINHATRAAKDRRIILQRGISAVNKVKAVAVGKSGRYFGVLPQPLSNGIWYFQIGNKDWRLVSRTRVSDVAQVHFQALKAHVSAQAPSSSLHHHAPAGS